MKKKCDVCGLLTSVRQVNIEKDVTEYWCENCIWEEEDYYNRLRNGNDALHHKTNFGEKSPDWMGKP